MSYGLTKKRAAIVAGVTVALAAAGAGMALAGGDDDPTDTSITGPALQRATEAALAETGEGRVTGTEVDDEDSKYEVEVTLDDGSAVDVQLDENFAVVGAAADSEQG
jgi:uncharacterized membrane protein YkoI